MPIWKRKYEIKDTCIKIHQIVGVTNNKLEQNRQETSKEQECRIYIGNDAISKSKEFSGKNGSKLAQRPPTNAHAKINKLKMVFRTNRRSLKYAPKEFSKVNERDLPWCYKNTQYSRQHRSVTHANPEWYVLTVSQWHRARLIFKQRCHVTTSSWIKILIHTGLRTGLYGRDLIH